MTRVELARATGDLRQLTIVWVDTTHHGLAYSARSQATPAR